ncbi:hypothetical protein [Dactylosporangium sp. NPDC000521]|uniref:hypothetical protein n=1 Tax=Dactylosporangium sp. NPDC000521 TaxID=3363975 RepID=UPI0036C43475
MLLARRFACCWLADPRAAGLPVYVDGLIEGRFWSSAWPDVDLDHRVAGRRGGGRHAVDVTSVGGLLVVVVAA